MCAITGKILWSVQSVLVCMVFMGLKLNAAEASHSTEKPYFSIELFACSKQTTVTSVVGEIISFTIRCVYDPQSYSVSTIIPPANPEIVMLALSEAKGEKTVVNGVACMMYEWQGAAYAKKAGNYEFGPFQIGGEQTATHSSRTIFRMMWSSSFSGYSNVVIFNVNDVPKGPFKSTYTGFIPVGNFGQHHAAVASVELEQCAMKKGEAQTLRYTFEFSGVGNFILVDHPELDLPLGLKYYPAQKKHESVNHFTFEYVIQAIEQGIMTIPAQEFFYFDPVLFEYRSLKTKPVRLHVSQGVNFQTSTQQVEQEDLREGVDISGADASSGCGTTHIGCVSEALLKGEPKFSFSGFSGLRGLEIPEKFFIGILFVLCVGILYLCMSEHVRCFYFFIQRRIRYYIFLRQIRVGYKKFQRDGDSMVLYENFKALRGMHCPASQEWNAFWNRLECMRFGKQLECDEREHFLHDLNKWARYFEKKIWQKK